MTPRPGTDRAPGPGAHAAPGRRATVLVSDLKGSTALAERLDPETLREIMDRYFDEYRSVLAVHGGRLEKVIGDAVVAAFGLDGDDPACGAADAVDAADVVRAALETLNGQLEARYGVRLVTRTGVCTGEVVAGSGGGVITGEAIQSATALEQACPPDGVLLSGSTREAAGPRVHTEPHGEVHAKALGTTVEAHVLLAVDARAEGRAARDSAADAAASRRESRRTVTIVFADARPAGGATTPPAMLQDAMSRYFAAVRGILERHGGTVEHYIGDAVMAVFGLERRHEDDALRAVRAAVEMRDALPAVNRELDGIGAPPLEQRIGVNTGNLVASDGATRQRLVTGDAVNVAARFEQAAAPGEVIIGGPTAALAGDAARLEEIAPLALKGKAEPVPAFRVISVAASGGRFRVRTPLVGRHDELGRLQARFREAAGGAGARLVAIMGDPGVGKSRLSDEIAEGAAAGGALVLRGECLAYGEGITFWPMVEIVQQAAGVTADDDAGTVRERLLALSGGAEDVTDRVGALIGLPAPLYQLDELFWGLQRLLATLSRRQPLVVEVDDMHRGETTLAEFLVQLAETPEARILVVAAGRPAMGERHGDLIGAAHETLVLGPLGPDEAARVAAGALGEDRLPAAVRDRVVQAAAGNPLFVEQLMSMLLDTGRLVNTSGRWRLLDDDLALPASIEAVVAARVDELPGEERATLEPAAVVGIEFSSPAVVTLAPAPIEDRVPALLDRLEERQLVAAIAEPDGPFDQRFTHPMIREVTYQGLLKRVRADLHERFAVWAESRDTDSGRASALEEIVGYHLEQAHRYHTDLGARDGHAEELGRRASARLGAAGYRARARGDMPSAANLLRRAAGTLPSADPDTPLLLVHAGQAEMETGRFPEADTTLERAAALARSAGRPNLAALARLERTRLAYTTGAGVSDEEVVTQAEGAVYAFTAARDDDGLAAAWRLLVNVHITGCRFGAAEKAMERSIDHAARAGNLFLVGIARPVLAPLTLLGPLPVDEAVERCQEIVEQVRGDRKAEAIARRALAHLRAMRGEVEQAMAVCTRSRTELQDLGWLMDGALVSLDSGPIALMADDPVGAEAELRQDFETLDAMGERNYISTTAALLAEALYRQDRLDEAARTVAFSREVAAEGDVATQIAWRSVHGKLLCRGGDDLTGVEVCREAVRLAAETDMTVTKGDAFLDLSEALRLSGDPLAARRAAADGREQYAHKGNLMGVARADRMMASLPRD